MVIALTSNSDQFAGRAELPCAYPAPISIKSRRRSTNVDRPEPFPPRIAGQNTELAGNSHLADQLPRPDSSFKSNDPRGKRGLGWKIGIPPSVIGYDREIPSGRLHREERGNGFGVLFGDARRGQGREGGDKASRQTARRFLLLCYHAGHPSN